MPDVQYQRTQFGWVTTVAVLAGVAGVIAGMLLSRASGWPAALQAAVLAVLLAALGCFYSLTVTVTDDAVVLHFGVGLLRIRLRLDDVVSAAAVKNPWYCGYGIHYVGKGWLYNVSGPDAVELCFRNGRRARVGTDDVSGLLAAVQNRLRDYLKRRSVGPRPSESAAGKSAETGDAAESIADAG